MESSISADPQQTEKPLEHVIVSGNARDFVQEVVSGKHKFRVDEPVSVGGTEAAPVGILPSPMIAGAAMSFSSVSVIPNALRLRSLRLD